MCSASGSTHTESGKLYHKVKHQASAKVSSRQHSKRAPTKRRSPRRLRRRAPHTEHGLGVWLISVAPPHVYLPRVNVNPTPRYSRCATGILVVSAVASRLLWGWPLQEIVLLRGFCARINHPFMAPSRLHPPYYCNTIAHLLRNMRRPPRPSLVCHKPYHIGDNNIV